MVIGDPGPGGDVLLPLVSPTPSSSSTSSSTGKDLEAETIEKMASGEWSVRPASNTKNDVWESFHVVVDKATNLEVGTGVCLACESVLITNRGTSSLRKHVQMYCHGQMAPADSSTAFGTVSSKLRDTFINKMADTCGMTMGSLNLLTSDAVVDMIQCAVNIASRCKGGRINVAELMPDATTVMARVDKRATHFLKELLPRIKLAIAEKRCQAATDMWTDDNQKRHFIEITVAFVDEAGKKTEIHDLVVAQFPSSMKATAANIRKAMYKAMKDIGFTHQEFDAIEWITDRGANIKKALEDLSR